MDTNEKSTAKPFNKNLLLKRFICSSQVGCSVDKIFMKTYPPDNLWVMQKPERVDKKRI